VAGLVLGRILVVLLGGLIVVGAKAGFAMAATIICVIVGLGLLVVFYVILFNRSTSHGPASPRLWSLLAFWGPLAASAVWTGTTFAPEVRAMIDRTAGL